MDADFRAYKYHLILYTDPESPTTDVVPLDRIKVVNNDGIKVKWGSKWYSAKILKSDGKKHNLFLNQNSSIKD